MKDLAISVLADPTRALTFDVVVRDARSESRHRVAIDADDAARWAKLGANPAHGVEDIGFPAPVRTDDGGYPFGKFQGGIIYKRFETGNLNSL